MYQTDQTRPFLFPFSRIRGQQRLVPFAIEEADNLYAKHMHVSLALYQMWRTREDCILDESGLQNLPPSVSGDLGPGGSSLTDRKWSIVSLPSTTFSRPTQDNTEQNDIPETALPDLVLLQNALKDADEAIAKAEQDGNRSDRRKAKEKREDILRLMRVEAIYVRSVPLYIPDLIADGLSQKATLPQMQNWVIVLLKLLLATVTATGANPPSAGTSQFPAVNGMSIAQSFLRAR